MNTHITISRELAERLIAASKVCTGQGCPPFHHDLALAGDDLRAALDAPARSGWRPIETSPVRGDLRKEPNRCLVWSKRAGIQMGWANIISGEPCAAGDGFNGEWGFTHWHPLPPPGDDLSTTEGITDSDRMDWLETQECWIGLTGEFETRPIRAAGRGYHETVRQACDAAINHEKQ